MKNITICSIFMLVLLGSIANVHAITNVLDVQSPTLLPIEEKGQAWEQTDATISGEGELKIKDGTTDVRYEGNISCEVSAYAGAAEKNKVEIKEEEIGIEVEAKSKTGTISVSSCNITDEYGIVYEIYETIIIPSGKVKIEIEQFGEDVNGNLIFSEYEAKGKVDSGKDPRVKLELKNGTITTEELCPDGSSPPCPCVPPCGGDGGGAGGF